MQCLVSDALLKKKNLEVLLLSHGFPLAFLSVQIVVDVVVWVSAF
jgi:hypothetical protein